MTTIVGCLSAPTTGAFTSFIRSSRLPRQTYPFESPLWTPQFNWFPVTKAIKLERHSTALTSYIDLYIYCLPICGLAYIYTSPFALLRRDLSLIALVRTPGGHQIYTWSVSGKRFSYFVTTETPNPPPPIKLWVVHWTVKCKSFGAAFKIPHCAHWIIRWMAFYWRIFLG